VVPKVVVTLSTRADVMMKKSNHYLFCISTKAWFVVSWFLPKQAMCFVDLVITINKVFVSTRANVMTTLRFVFIDLCKVVVDFGDLSTSCLFLTHPQRKWILFYIEKTCVLIAALFTNK